MFSETNARECGAAAKWVYGCRLSLFSLSLSLSLSLSILTLWRTHAHSTTYTRERVRVRATTSGISRESSSEGRPIGNCGVIARHGGGGGPLRHAAWLRMRRRLCLVAPSFSTVFLPPRALTHACVCVCVCVGKRETRGRGRGRGSLARELSHSLAVGRVMVGLHSAEKERSTAPRGFMRL